MKRKTVKDIEEDRQADRDKEKEMDKYGRKTK